MIKKKIYTPVITPLDSNGHICEFSVHNIIDKLKETVDGVIPCLTSGEGWKLTDLLWEDMLKYSVQYAGKDNVMVGIERATTKDVIKLIDVSLRYQPYALVVPAPFGEEVSQDDIIKHYQDISNHSESNILIYNESALSGNEIHFDTLLSISKIKNIVGIKDSPANSRPEHEILALKNSGLTYYIGWEEDLHMGKPNDGNIVSLSNVYPILCIESNHEDIRKKDSLLVENLIAKYSLSHPEWYKYLKLHLYSENVISSPLLVK